MENKTMNLSDIVSNSELNGSKVTTYGHPAGVLIRANSKDRNSNYTFAASRAKDKPYEGSLNGLSGFYVYGFLTDDEGIKKISFDGLINREDLLQTFADIIIASIESKVEIRVIGDLEKLGDERTRQHGNSPYVLCIDSMSFVGKEVKGFGY